MKDLASLFYVVGLVLAVLKIFELITIPWWVIACIGFAPLLMTIVAVVLIVTVMNLFKK